MSLKAKDIQMITKMLKTNYFISVIGRREIIRNEKQSRQNNL